MVSVSPEPSSLSLGSAGSETEVGAWAVFSLG